MPSTQRAAASGTGHQKADDPFFRVRVTDSIPASPELDLEFEGLSAIVEGPPDSEGADGPWQLAFQGTFAPNGSHRWMASVALDGSGNMAMGYSIVNADLGIFPSLGCTVRPVNEPERNRTPRSSDPRHQ